MRNIFKRKSRITKVPINDVTPPPSYPPEATISENVTSSARSNSYKYSSNDYAPITSKASHTDKRGEQQKLVFHCQLAHGSPTGVITGFSNVKELYQKIAECFEIPVSTILFCTLNTHKIEMSKLLGGQIGLNDFIFIHVKGQAKEIEVVKTEPALGLTITDNGAGYSFIKRIKEESVIERLQNLVKVGDHIEKINDTSFVGTRHFQVAKMLKDIPVGSTFKLRLVEPNAFGFQIEPPQRRRKSSDIKNGSKTLRFKADGKASIEEVDHVMVKAIERINGLLETYIGINDSDLAQQIWDLAENKNNPSDFALAIDDSELGSFNFTDNFVFDIWAAIGDVKDGRIPEEKEFENERL
ncbi:unnamed protein product [Rotaria magnacalcarata]|uniref:PDZ domain-containing protein n=3 Tax=Rotaria magnacalcarata TaxID=392030 RepID=A0A814M713_9BILA|nr:unnamed protein product [Rotaria magnacalcarata]CAF1610110.1 unnamed protein product [Rotaria magnacalcarata]CAF2092164.1 unnamed protein product [Rotaria magnacalcarata]CAF2122928.1 unnamed protein product [Rotaria magnacalcarata]CAF2151386.1 unnamed protein product [Rotaria magnacalcarata]